MHHKNFSLKNKYYIWMERAYKRIFFCLPLDLDEHNVDASNTLVDLLTSVLRPEHNMVNSLSRSQHITHIILSTV
jgi:hypothetical protein